MFDGGKTALEQAIDAAFHADVKAAVEVELRLEGERDAKAGREFDAWAVGKDKLRAEKNRQEEREEKEKEEKRLEREKRGQEGYERWCDLRRAGAYRSSLDSKVHTLPPAAVATHAEDWRGDFAEDWEMLRDEYRDGDRDGDGGRVHMPVRARGNSSMARSHDISRSYTPNRQ
ncbi:hypothetical protein B484DRAFT_460192 [Ochromonadaceae sp. CCMP2298]|nr:hypothetical protein B484DRAFT_460192 [Ochromonadaceae sp. CCMP2298]